MNWTWGSRTILCTAVQSMREIGRQRGATVGFHLFSGFYLFLTGAKRKMQNFCKRCLPSICFTVFLFLHGFFLSLYWNAAFEMYLFCLILSYFVSLRMLILVCASLAHVPNWFLLINCFFPEPGLFLTLILYPDFWLINSTNWNLCGRYWNYRALRWLLI